MTEEDIRKLSKDPDGLLTYEYLANHMGEEGLEVERLVENMVKVDATGQFLVSAARYLAAIDREGFDRSIRLLADAAIERDRERRYLVDLLPALWGADYGSRAEELRRSDDTFRRIIKRVEPSAMI